LNVTDTHSSKAPKLRIWRWPPLKVYNGFVSEERVRCWQLQWLLIDLGQLELPRQCSITGSRCDVTFHSENYFQPTAIFGISAGAHKLLHQRFYRPDAWREFVVRYAVTGEEWFASLALEPVDLAWELRLQLGSDWSLRQFVTALPDVTINPDEIYREG
jgi:hypothetical protein